MVLDIQSMAVEGQTILSPYIKQFAVLLKGNVHMLRVWAESCERKREDSTVLG